MEEIVKQNKPLVNMSDIIIYFVTFLCGDF